MLINFNEIPERTAPGMNGGTGEMTAKMFMEDVYKRQDKYIAVINNSFCKVVVRYWYRKSRAFVKIGSYIMLSLIHI